MTDRAILRFAELTGIVLTTLVALFPGIHTSHADPSTWGSRNVQVGVDRPGNSSGGDIVGTRRDGERNGNRDDLGHGRGLRDGDSAGGSNFIGLETSRRRIQRRQCCRSMTGGGGRAH